MTKDKIDMCECDKAWNEGHDAGRAGKLKSECPYSDGTELARHWDGGYQLGEFAREDDAVIAGEQGFREGVPESGIPSDVPSYLQTAWLEGYRAEAFRAANGPLDADGYTRVCKEADTAYLESLEAGIAPSAPYPKRTEHQEVWATRLMDCPLVYGHAKSDFEVLGFPIPVAVLAEHADGAITYAIPSPTMGAESGK